MKIKIHFSYSHLIINITALLKARLYSSFGAYFTPNNSHNDQEDKGLEREEGQLLTTHPSNSLKGKHRFIYLPPNRGMKIRRGICKAYNGYFSCRSSISSNYLFILMSARSLENSIDAFKYLLEQTLPGS